MARLDTLRSRLRRAIRRPRIVIPVLVAGAVVGGALVVWLGLVSVAARDGHGFPMSTLLPFARSRSVDFHAAGVDPPAERLDSPALVRRGAAHYADACATCHGAPGTPRQPFAMRMLPVPPRLDRGEVVGDRRDEELYWVVWSGVKYAGMPGWPSAERRDEPWSLVAFLRRIPSLSAQEYRRLAGLDAQRRARDAGDAGLEGGAQAALAGCAQCHGVDGAGDASGAFPNLTLLDEQYLRLSLRAYARGDRQSGVMRSQIYDHSSATLDALAAHYAAQPMRVVRVVDRGADRLEAGRRIAERGIPARGLASCASCHGILEQTPIEADEEALYYPRIAGQYAPYLRQQLRAWVDDARGGIRGERPPVDAAHRLEPEEIEAVSAYYAARDPAGTARR